MATPTPDEARNELLAMLDIFPDHGLIRIADPGCSGPDPDIAGGGPDFGGHGTFAAGPPYPANSMVVTQHRAAVVDAINNRPGAELS
jgi:hypothetical protein